MNLQSRMTLMSSDTKKLDELKFKDTKSRTRWRSGKKSLLATLKKQKSTLKSRMASMGDAKALDPE